MMVWLFRSVVIWKSEDRFERICRSCFQCRAMSIRLRSVKDCTEGHVKSTPKSLIYSRKVVDLTFRTFCGYSFGKPEMCLYGVSDAERNTAGLQYR